jgi:hypothetical protein
MYLQYIRSLLASSRIEVAHLDRLPPCLTPDTHRCATMLPHRDTLLSGPNARSLRLASPRSSSARFAEAKTATTPKWCLPSMPGYECQYAFAAHAMSRCLQSHPHASLCTRRRNVSSFTMPSLLLKCWWRLYTPMSMLDS